jgi:porin
MVISPKIRGLRTGLGKVALVSGLALILVMFALPMYALPGDPPAASISPVGDQPAPDAQPAGDPPSPADPDPQASSTPPPPPVGWSFVHQEHMLNWGPERARLAERGLTFDFHYITDAFGDPVHPAGTAETFGNWQRIRGTVDVDFGKFSEMKGLLFHVTGVWQNGVNMGGVIGSIANPSGIVSSHQFRMDSISLTQKFMDSKVQLTAGIMAAQDLYGLQAYIGSFLSEPLFYNFGNMGNTRTSYDPESAPAVNLKIVPSKAFFVQTGYFLPSDDGEEHVYPTGFNYSNGHHGGTWDTAVGIYTDPNAPTTRKSYPGIYQVGFIYNGSQAGIPLSSPSGIGGFFDYGSGRYVNGNWLFYVQINQPVFRAAAGSDRGLDIAFGVNTGPQNKSEVPTEFTGGLIFRGPIPHRGKDSLAFGMVYSKIGSDFNHYNVNPPLIIPLNAPTPTGVSLNDEKVYEINYKIQLFPWLTVQPAWQQYSNVGGRQVGSASLAGLRLVADF